MAQQATNDPNYFLNSIASGEFNGASTDETGYGFLPAAEQNQTYFVYSNGISSAEPEFIGQTLYNIKYLIDENGNVYKPNSDQLSLFNLKNNFSRQNMIVETQTATQVLSNLLGEQQITDIGSLQPLIFSENGTAKNDYEPTMSFFIENSAFVSGSNLNDIIFTSPTDLNDNILLEGFKNTTIYYKGDIQTGGSGVTFTFNPQITLGNTQTQFNTASGEYTFSLQGGATNTIDYGADVAFNFTMYTYNISTALTTSGFSLFQPASIQLNINIEHSTDGGSSWSSLPLINNSTLPGTFQNGNFVPGASVGSILVDNTFGLTMPNIAVDTNAEFNINLSTYSQNFNNNDKIRVKLKYSFTTNVVITPSSNSREFIWISNAQFKAITNYSADLITSAPYFVGATWPTDQSTPQYLTASSGLSNFINQNPGYVYYPSSSLLNETIDGYGFNRPALPLNPQIGDYIRFEYDKNKQSRIYDISSLQDGKVVFKIYPSIPTGSQLNHFVLTRITNDGGSILTPVRKQSDGTFTSFIKPQYISETLSNNFPSIINTLEKDGLLTT